MAKLIVLTDSAFVGSTFAETTADMVPANPYRVGSHYLRGAELEGYERVRAGMLAGEKNIVLPRGIDAGRAHHLVTRAREDTPELIAVSNVAVFRTGDRANPTSLRVELGYDMTDAQSVARLRQIEARVKPLVDAAPMLPVEKRIELAHDWLSANCNYSPVRDTYDDSIVGPFLMGTARCVGFSKAFKYLMDRMGVQCIVCSGNVKENGRLRPGEVVKFGTHAWNLVAFGNARDPRWSHVDVTFDREKDTGYVGHGFFGLSDREADYTYQVACQNEYPICPVPVDWHRANGFLCHDADDVERVVRGQVARNNLRIEIKVGDMRTSQKTTCDVVCQGVQRAMRATSFTSFSLVTSKQSRNVVGVILKRCA